MILSQKVSHLTFILPSSWQNASSFFRFFEDFFLPHSRRIPARTAEKKEIVQAHRSYTTTFFAFSAPSAVGNAV